MGIIAYDRANVTSNSTGTGTIVLDSAVSGFVNFANVGHNNQIYYTISLPDQSEWEVGVGTIKANSIFTTYAMPVGGADAFMGLVLAPNGELHFVPSSSSVGAKISKAGVVSTYSLILTGSAAYAGGVLDQRGDIHFVPSNAVRGQKINPITGAVSTYSIVLTGNYACGGGVLASDGSVYFLPQAGATTDIIRGQRINPAGVVSTFSMVQPSGFSGSWYRLGGLGFDGDIYLFPRYAIQGQKISKAGIASTFAYGATTFVGGLGGVLDFEGNIYGTPDYNSGGRGNRINTITGVVTTYFFPNGYQNNFEGAGCAVLNDGRIFFGANATNVVGILFDPKANTFVTIETVAPINFNGTRSANGEIYFTSSGADTGTLIKPSYELERNLILASSNTDNLVNFSAGTKYVFSGTPAAVFPGTVPTGDDSSIGTDLVAWKNYQRLLLKNISAGNLFVNPLVLTRSTPFIGAAGTYSGGTLNQAGDVYFIPSVGSASTNNTGLKYNYLSGVVSTYALVKGYNSGFLMYNGGVLAPNGDIHMVPVAVDVGQKISASGIVSTYTLVYTSSQFAYRGGVLAPNGNIHFVPNGAPVGQKIAVDGTVSTYSLVYTTRSAYYGGVLAPNGDIHFVPLQAAVGQKVAANGTVSTYSLVYTTVAGAYEGGVLDVKGEIHFVPNGAPVGQKINGITGAVSTYSLILTGPNSYSGGVLGPDGQIYFVPMRATAGQRINSFTGEVSTYSLVYTTANAYNGGVLTPDGGIFLANYLADRLQVIFPTGRPFDLDVVTNPFFSKY